MQHSKIVSALAALALLTAAVVNTGCVAGRLPDSVRRDIAWEHDKLQNAAQQIAAAETTVRDDLAAHPDLFANTPVAADWPAKLRTARDTLNSAQAADRQLAEILQHNRADSRDAAERLLSRERDLRESALDDSQRVENAAAKWIGFRQDLAAHLNQVQREYDGIHTFDFAATTAAVDHAAHDWPAKKETLETRLAALRAIPQDAQKEWDTSAAARADAAQQKITGPEIAVLIQTDDDLARDVQRLQSGAGELTALSGQLYNSWDKILTDLDVAQQGPDRLYRERIKTVRTHWTDVAAHQTETSSDESWQTVSESSFHAVENDLGMAIAHKDAGLFDSEAQTTPQPAGFAYIAPESQGSNQYGYWTHSGGQTFWTFLPEYLILRELLWNHDYRPVVLDDYRAYRVAQVGGRTYYGTYYGQTTPSAPPRYGSHGTFTQTHYANSRYVQSGGFAASRYGSHGTGGGQSAFNGFHPDERRAAPGENGAGKRFGSGAGSPSGRRFGQAPRLGRAFGRRH